MKEIKSLQNGTDIRGIAIKHLDYEVNLTPEAVRLIANGFVLWMRKIKNNKEGNLKVAVGMDSRLSGDKLKTALIDTLIKSGCDVYDCGICTTPAMFMTTILDNYKCDGSIMITASHLPYYYNGLKFFTQEGGCEKEDIEDILNYAEDTVKDSEAKGTVKKINFLDVYSQVLVDKIRSSVNSSINYDKPLLGSKVIVDAGNGSGGFFAHKVLKELGADIQGSQFLNPDGTFPNHIPNPENEEAMESIKKAVLSSGADLGIIFDTDVDRAAIVSRDGEEINKNSLIALISSIILKEHPQSVIVTDSITSTGLTEFITQLGGIHHRFKRGYKNVINESKRLNAEGKESFLAIETSGHAALKENYFLDDGAYLISKILVKMAQMKAEGKEISSIISNLKHPKESKEIRFKIEKADFKIYGENIISDLRGWVKSENGWNIEPNNYEGIKINCSQDDEKGWFLLRMSLHEPVLCLNIESEVSGGVNNILDKLKVFLGKYEVAVK